MPANHPRAARRAVKGPPDRVYARGNDIEAVTCFQPAFLDLVVSVIIQHGPAGNDIDARLWCTQSPKAVSTSDPPTSIRALQSEQILEVTWPEGLVERFPYRLLRGECPCAACRDEWTGQRKLDPQSVRPDLKIEGMEHVGIYAIQLVWNDGHSSGLFTWETLRALGQPRPESG
jgi:DUF971 family protein